MRVTEKKDGSFYIEMSIDIEMSNRNYKKFLAMAKKEDMTIENFLVKVIEDQLKLLAVHGNEQDHDHDNGD